MLILVKSLFDGSFVPLLSVSLIVFWPEWPRIQVIGWLSGQVRLSQLRFVVVWMTRSSLSSGSSGWCGLYLYLWGLFFQLVWVVPMPM